MYLPWRKAKVPPERFEEARAAISAAQEHLEAARARDPEVRELSRTIRHYRQQNHFTPGLVAILRYEQGRRGDHADGG